MRTNHTELFEWVSGGAPAFDNASFTESEEFGDLIPADMEKSLHITELREKATDFSSNAVSGNRTNLLFVESANCLIQENQR